MKTYVSERSEKVKAACKFMFTFTLMSAFAFTFCANTNATAASVLSGVMNVVCDIAKYVGLVLCASGIFQLILAYKDDNADGQSRAVRLVVVALALLSLKVFLQTAGLM